MKGRILFLILALFLTPEIARAGESNPTGVTAYTRATDGPELSSLLLSVRYAAFVDHADRQAGRVWRLIS